MQRIPVRKLRQGMSDALNRVAYGGERMVIERRGNRVAALVSIEDLELLEAIEDRIDMEAARRLLADSRQKPVPWAKVKRQLGL